jgi:3-hydroxyacyl-[acyl-carrier-protein] dehydratase
VNVSEIEDKVEEQVVYDAQQILKILPHRYPGHFPGQPVMPGVMVLEAMAQTAAVLAKQSVDGVKPDKTVFLVGATDFKWKRKVVPGDTLRIEMISVRKRRPLWIMSGEVTVDGKFVASGTLSAAEA